MTTRAILFLGAVSLVCTARAADLHVATNGNDANAGTQAAPFRTIQHAADLAQPGDMVTVHAGIYRERVNPSRGGDSDTKRIVYQAAPGEKVVIKGSEIVKGWERIQNDTWKVTLPNSFFGRFNPYRDVIHGDWFAANGRVHHTGAVYLNGHWLTEAAKKDDVLKRAGENPLWFTDGGGSAEYLLNVGWLRPGKDAAQIPAVGFAAKRGTQNAACAEGGQCVGFIKDGDWLRYDRVDFGSRTKSVEIRAASVTGGGRIELRLDKPDGELLGTCTVADTGDWQKWASFSAKIEPTSGAKTLYLVVRPQQTNNDTIAIWAQLPGVNPNDAGIEINARQTVFYPDKPGRNYITVRGFTMEQAATPWAPPTAEQKGLIGTHWSKGWVIENNLIRYSTCCGIALGKYGDEWDNRAESAEGYVGTLTRALKHGWNKATVGSHIVRNNHISHCEQTGVVGSLGCSFSTVTGNQIHDIHVRQLFGGAEMAGIKFHGAVDVTISHNHIYRCGNTSGIWLDWMAQGAQVTGNLMHGNTGGFGDLFFEMQHGPILVANNILLSKRMSFALNSQGIAAAHNLITGPIDSMRSDTRSTPFHLAHTTTVAGLYPAAKGDSGDHRFYNNVFAAPCSLHAIDNAVLPCFAGGNVFTRGTQPSKFDSGGSLAADIATAAELEQLADGWYLTLTEDKKWGTHQTRQLVTTELLGKAKIPDRPFENADGSPIRIDTDYFGHQRNEANPFPGPFELPEGGRQRLKVW
jgi:hypothetical protein